jgi:hypothetical protein
MAKKRAKIVPVTLTAEIRDVVDTEVQRLKSLGSKLRITRAIAIQSLLRKGIRNLQPDESGTYEQYLNQASVFKLKGGNHQILGETGLARSVLLRAAAFELLALSTLTDPPDSAIIRHLVEIVELTKEGTGYKSLPDARFLNKTLSTIGNA